MPTMDDLFARLNTFNLDDDVYRNIKSLRESRDLYSDLSDKPSDWQVAIQLEMDTKPPGYTHTPIIRRVFERAAFIHAIEFPFRNWSQSRFSNGRFGVWYGADCVETTVYESVYHWRRFLDAAGFEQHDRPIQSERKVYKVHCHALLLDFRAQTVDFPALLDKEDYTFTQGIGARLHHEGHPGLITESARKREAWIIAVFTWKVLTKPRDHCFLRYRFVPESGSTEVYRSGNNKWMVI